MKTLMFLIIMTNMAYGFECRGKVNEDGIQNQYIVSYVGEQAYLEFRKLKWRGRELVGQKSIMGEKVEYYGRASYGVNFSAYSGKKSYIDMKSIRFNDGEYRFKIDNIVNEKVECRFKNGRKK